MNNTYQIKVNIPIKEIEVLNASFDTNLSNWTQTNFTWDNINTAAKKTIQGNVGALWQTISILSGHTYKIKYTIKETHSVTPIVLNGYEILLGGNYSGIRYGSGTFEINMICGSMPPNLVFQTYPNWTGYIDNISVTEIEQVELDLLEGVQIPITYQINTPLDMGKRSAGFTYDIDIPGTINNHSAFKYLYDINENNIEILNKKFECEVYDNEIKIFNGWLQLNKINNVNGLITYSINIVQNLISLAESLGDKLMYGNPNPDDDIDLSEYDHTLTFNNISGSWNFPSNDTDAYFYPVIDRGYNDPNFLSTLTANPISTLKPAISIKHIFDKIVSKAGFTYSSSFWDSLPKKLTYYRELDITTDAIDITGSYTDVQISGSDFTISTDQMPPHGQISGDPVIFNNAIADDLTQFNIYSHEWVCQREGQYEFNFSGSIDLKLENLNAYKAYFGEWNLYSDSPELRNPTNNKLYPFIYYRIDLWKSIDNGTNWFIADSIQRTNDSYINAGEDPNGVNATSVPNSLLTGMTYEGYVGSHMDYCFSLDVGSSTSVTYVEDIKFHEQPTTYVGDRYKIGIYLNNLFTKCRSVYSNFMVNGLTGNSKASITAHAGTQFIVDRKIGKIGEGDTIRLNRYFGNDIKQIDFITSILNQFNLVLVQDNINSYKFIMETFQNYFNLNFGVVDWTNKLDNSDAIDINSPTKYNELYIHYTEDDDRLNKEYKNLTGKLFGEYKDKYDRIGETNEITSIFAPTPMAQYGTTQIYCPFLYRVNDQGEVESTNSSAFKPRILFANKFTGNYGTWTLVSNIYGANRRNFTTFYPYVGHLDDPYTDTYDLNFGHNDIYYNNTTDKTITSNNIFNQYYRYSQYLYFGTHAKKLIANFNLNQQDISQLNFRKLIYINDTYYILSSISNYSSGKLTNCELIKYTPYKLPQILTNYPIEHLQISSNIIPRPFPINPNENISSNDIIVGGTRSIIAVSPNSNIINGVDSSIKNAHDVLLLNTKNLNINEISNLTYIGEKVFLKTDPIVSPDIIDSGADNILNPFGCSVFNVIDGGKDIVRSIGSCVITQIFDGNR